MSQAFNIIDLPSNEEDGGHKKRPKLNSMPSFPSFDNISGKMKKKARSREFDKEGMDMILRELDRLAKD